MFPRWAKRLFHQATIHDQAYRFMFEKGPPNEYISIDCETTGLNPKVDDIITVAAVKIVGKRILSSEKFLLTARPDAKMVAEAIKIHRLRASDVEDAQRLYNQMPALLQFIGGRPLVGYYIDFDVAMINKYLLPFAGMELPNPLIEVSKIYYERKYGDAPAGTHVDLSFKNILADLKLPVLDAHDAFNDAMMTAQMFVALSDLKKRGVRIPRAKDARPPMNFG